MDNKLPLKGAWSGHVTHFQFRHSQYYYMSGTAEVRVAKFCMEVEYIKL